MLPVAHAGLTTPVVAGSGCNEWLGVTAGKALLKLIPGNRAKRFWLRPLLWSERKFNGLAYGKLGAG